MVHFIFMDHKNFDVYFILFLWPELQLRNLAWWAQSVRQSQCLLAVGFLFCCCSSFAFSFSSSAHSISFTHTNTLTHTFIFDIFTYRFIHLYQLLLLLLLVLSTLLTVPFRSLCSVSALHAARLSSVRLAYKWICVCVVRLFFIRLHFKWDNTKESLYSCSTQLNSNKSVIVSRNIPSRMCRRSFFFFFSLNI